MSTQPSQINPTETPIDSGHRLEDLLDITRAAKLLGISPKTLYNKLREYGSPVPEE